MDERSKAQREIRAERCPWCKHDIRGLPATVCPECGNDWSKWVTRPDPGNRVMGRIGVVLAFVLVLAVAVLQQTSESVAERASDHKVKTVKSAPEQAPLSPPSTQFELTAEALTKVAIFENDKDFKQQAVKTAQQQASSVADRFRVAIVAGDLEGEPAGRDRLDQVEKSLPAGDPLLDDIGTVRAIYDGNAEPRKVTELEKRHGWFGRLAATFGLPGSDEDRRAVAGGGAKIMSAVWIGGWAVGLVVLASGALFITGLIGVLSGHIRPAFVPPAPGGSVPIETVVVFIGAFILLKIVSGVIEAVVGNAAVAVVATLALQWSLIGVLLWPMARGVSFRQTREMWGLHRGRGVLREMICGVGGYLALLPVMVAGVVVSLVLVLIYETGRRILGAPEMKAPENPIIDLVASGTNVWLLVLLGMLASLWAPLVEESIFRGAFYRQLRTRWSWLPAGLVTALCFGLMHGYPVLLLGPVIALGFGFAMMREWRGSIIASMTAHCLHNTTVLCLLLLATKFISGGAAPVP